VLAQKNGVHRLVGDQPSPVLLLGLLPVGLWLLMLLVLPMLLGFTEATAAIPVSAAK